MKCDTGAEPKAWQSERILRHDLSASLALMSFKTRTNNAHRSPKTTASDQLLDKERIFYTWWPAVLKALWSAWAIDLHSFLRLFPQHSTVPLDTFQLPLSQYVNFLKLLLLHDNMPYFSETRSLFIQRFKPTYWRVFHSFSFLRPLNGHFLHPGFLPHLFL